MPFTRPTLQTIIDRIEADIVSRLIGQVALLRNALLTILAKVFAGAIHTCYGYLDYISINFLPDLAEAYWLERYGVQYNLPRLAAAFAEGDVKFTGSNGTYIPIDTKLVRDDGIEYITTAGGTISGGELTLNAESLVAGLDSNTEAGILFTIFTPIAGVDDAVEVVTMGGGTDEETDDVYRARLLFRIQHTPAGGAEHDYVTLGMTVDGIAGIFVFGNYNGINPELGYVTVVVLGVSPKIPGAGLLTDVENVLAPIVPITADLVVDPITEATIDIDISITPNTTEVQDAIEASIEELFDVDGAPGGTITISRLRNAIATAGPTDYEITDIEVDTVSIGVDDIVLTDHDYPILGTVTFALLT